MPTAEEFRKELYSRIYQAEKRGAPYVDVLARDVHRAAGDYPGPNHRMPNCCSVMRQEWRHGDEIISKKMSDGASFSIRYKLPRKDQFAEAQKPGICQPIFGASSSSSR